MIIVCADNLGVVVMNITFGMAGACWKGQQNQWITTVRNILAGYWERQTKWDITWNKCKVSAFVFQVPPVSQRWNRGDRVRRGVKGSVRRQAGLFPWIGITASVNGINISLRPQEAFSRNRIEEVRKVLTSLWTIIRSPLRRGLWSWVSQYCSWETHRG